jgi:hypothetical protein
MNRTITLKLLAITFACCLTATAQASKTFTQGGLSFDYPSNWTLQDISNKDAQQLALTKPDSDVQIVVFVHQGRITPEKLPDAKKAFIDPYIAARTKQLQDMGAKTEQQKPDVSEIGGVKADGVVVSASLGGETGAAKIYWAIVGQRVVVLTFFGPDAQMKQLTPAWDLIRTSLKVVDPKAVPSPSPTPSPE